VEHKKRSKKVTHTIKSLGMEINSSKEANFNFDSLKTSSDDDFNLLDPSMNYCENKPRSASHMPSNIQTYITTTSIGILALNEGALEFANKESKIKPMPFKDNLMQAKYIYWAYA